MVKRIQLLQDTYMQLDSQWQIVLCGSVIDVPDSFNIGGKQGAQLSPAESTKALDPHGKPTSVRNVRTR